MLGDPRTVRVTGDETAAVHRRSEDADAEDRPADYQDRPVPEAYVWSNLTSGNSSRALWLLLLPFMVVNLAHWMRPAARGMARLCRLYGLLVRVVALTLTVLLVGAACEVALDLAAWQCAGRPACAGQRSWLGFLSPAGGGWWTGPGRRLALAALVPTALTVLLWYLSHRTWSSYESERPLPGLPEPDDGETGGHPALGRPGFWYGRRLVARLRAAHTAAGLLTVAATLSFAAAGFDRGPHGDPVLAVLGAVLQCSLGAAALVVLWVVCSRGRSERRLDMAIDGAITGRLPAASAVLLALAVLHTAWDRPGWASHGLLPGNQAFGVIALLQGLLVVALGITAVLLRRSAPDPRAALRGLGGPAVAMLGCALGGVMTGGVAQRVGDWLDGPGTPGMGNGLIKGPPEVLSWQAAVIPPLIVVLLALAAYFAVRTWRVKRELLGAVPAEYPEERPDTARTRRIAGTRARAGLTDRAPWFVGATALVTLVLGAAALTGAWTTRKVPGRAAEGTPPFVESFAETSQALGSWLIGFGFILFVTWARRAYRDATARRTIGILWDVGTYWPRAAHPFAPPCYAERAVPDLTWRMAAWTGAHPDGLLVISGHSQGSVLAASAVWQLDPGTRAKVALLTYGSPLERLYGRWFPAHFGPDCLRALHDETRCWRNLWRATDPIGGPVRLAGDGGADVDLGPLKDPLAYGRTRQHPLPAPILGHSDYRADPSFESARSTLLELLRPGAPVPRQPPGPGPERGTGTGDRARAGTGEPPGDGSRAAQAGPPGPRAHEAPEV
nr:hypothetical protein [Streptomyces sp. GC420]